MINLEKYIEHCAGLYDFLAWLEGEVKNGYSYQISNQVIYLNPLVSRYFSLGVSQSKRSKRKPFLAMQPVEAEWFSLINWNKIILREKDNYIYFISSSVLGDQKDYPDIPSFAIALYIDTKEKKELLEGLETLNGREYFMDDTGEIHINFHKLAFNLPIVRYSAKEKIVSEESIVDYSLLLAQKEQGIQDSYSEMPDFIGNIGQSEGNKEIEELMKKWKNNEL